MMSQQYNKRRRYKPDTTVFHSSSKINPTLLEDVINCYQKGHTVCKYCYYRKLYTGPVTKTVDGYTTCNGCSSTKCSTVWLMPASQYCSNFYGILNEVPIPPAPKWSLDKANKPFGICSRKIHQSCFEMSGTAPVWFAHTIEELVVWTVERDFNCSFHQYIDEYYYGNRSVLPLSTPAMSVVTEKDGKSIIKESDLNSFSDSEEELLDPSKISFDGIDDIPEYLLQSVIDNYKMAVKCCRYCYYYETRVTATKEEKARGYWRCKECKRKWNYIIVIPASKYCMNFGNFKSVSISVPATSTAEFGPHYYCNRDDHYRCFQKYAENGLKYAHSLEELVIWTVEKEIGYGNFTKFIKDREWVVNGKQVNTTLTDHDTGSKHKYVPGGGNMYPTISSIPSELLYSLYECYKKRFNTCRVCFFESLEDKRFNDNPTLSSKEDRSNMCERGHYWKPIRVIPASKLCESYGTIIGISPYPGHMNKNKAPFQVCNYQDHNVCFEKSREINCWFPHTIEEIIVWTVERETGNDFADNCKNYAMEDNTKKRNLITVKELENNIDEIIPAVPTRKQVEGIKSPETDVIYQPETEIDEHGNLSSTLLFVDEESDEEIIDKPASEQKDNINITDYFPALTGRNSQSTAQTSSTSFMTQVIPTAGYNPSLLPILQPLSSPFPSVMTPSLAPSSKQTTEGNTVTLSEDEDCLAYECYLCYREFMSAKGLANHSSKQSHINIMKTDLFYEQLWNYYPFPPDQIPEDFTICTRSSTCPGRIKCGSAHSLEEKEEWIKRYHHRISTNYKGNNPIEVISNTTGQTGVKITPNTDSMESIRVYVKPSVIQQYVFTYKRLPEWRINVHGQGWQTLLGIEVVSSAATVKSETGSPFIISSIKGDTIYTIRPRSSAWIAPMFEEGILLGSIVINVKATTLAIGSHGCHVKLHLGLHKYLYIDLQAIITSV